jgi:transposase-like protein
VKENRLSAVMWSLTNLTSALAQSEASAGAEREARPSSLAFTSVMAGSIQKSSRTAKKASIQAIIRGKVDLASTIHTDGFRSYDGIVHMGYKKPYRIRHDRDELVRGTAHINGIEGFWGLAKTRLVKFKGMSPATFYLHLEGV